MKGQTNAWLKDIVSGEKISITLTTNQSSHTDLMGAVVTVSYAGNLTEYTWEGSAIQTVIPPMTDYTVSYSNVNGYSTPEPFSGKAMDGRVSEVIGTYNTEVVTVNVSAEEGEVSGYEIQIISDGNVLYTQTTSSASYKIPYGTSYTVKASGVSGYTTPTEQLFTASQPSRNVDVIYGAALKGVFIQDIYGRLHTEDEWDGTQTANGVAVVTDNCSFVVAKEDAMSSNLYWGGSDTDIPTLTNYNKSTDAATDFDGLGNTSKIITAIGNTNDGYRSGSAAGDCRNYIFSNGVDGYLGSAGEWQAIHDNKEVINSLLALIGGQLIASGHYWTSTERDSEIAFETWFGNGATGISYNYKYYDFKVRPLAKLISEDDITTFYINITKHSCVKGTTWGQWCKSSFNTGGWYVDSDGKTIVREYMPEDGIIEYVDGVSATVSATDVISEEQYFRNEKKI